MQSMATLSTEDLKAFSKCGQLYSILEGKITESSIKQAKRVIRKKGDINFQIPSSCLSSYKDLLGNTLLHIAWNSYSSEITKDLIDLGADFTIKNVDGETALHVALSMCSTLNNKLMKYQDDSHINLILSAHVKFVNFSNPCNKNGFSHFHIACMANHVKAVQFFLENGININEAVNKEAGRYLGFTPLHFAVKCYSFETIELLLDYGADKSIKNHDKMTPLHQILNQRIELLGMIKREKREKDIKILEEQIEKSERIIFILLGNSFLDTVDIVDSSGLSSLHIACTMQDLSKVESLLNQIKDINHCVYPDSSMWPGYTALHFAACCNANAMKLLHSRGANVDVEDANGSTPFDICLEMGHVEDIHTAISLKSEWADILFSDNKTRLVNFLSALQDTTQLSTFLCNCVDDINMKLPNNSPLWPSCAPLHLAVIISTEYKDLYSRYAADEESILEQIKELLNNGADVTQTDVNGMSPLHDAYREEKTQVTELLMKHHHSSANPVDKENLSHLHIACIEQDQRLVEKLLSNDNVDVNIAFKGEKAVQDIQPGWTPMNCAGYYLKEMLIERGATVSSSDNRFAENSLHSACEKGDLDAVQRLLESGADVDLALDDGRTPLHIAVEKKSLEVVQLLLQRGADVVGKNEDGRTPLSRVFYEGSYTLTKRRLIVLELKKHEDLQKRMEKETGVTMLHIACYMLDVDEVRNKLEQGVEVNTRVHEDSKLWPGCTALHVLMTKVKDGLAKGEDASYVKVIIKLLLEKGTDVALANANKDTPVHLSYVCKDEDSVSRTKALLEYHRDFRNNPVNENGLTHFHLAVMLNCVEVVEKFLEHGVNVNQPTEFIADSTDTCTPLLIAIENLCKQSDMQIVNLLLSHNADVNLEDSWGKSPLLKVLQSVKAGSSRKNLIEKLLSHGANINSEDIYGVTPFECLLRCDNTSAEDIRFFVGHGCRVNFSNPADDEGYLGIILTKKDKALRDSLFEELMKALDVSRVNELSRTLIHNAVAVQNPAVSCCDYVNMIKSFEIFGYDIDDQDLAGQTALHLAALFGNDKAITALLNMGADVDIVDAKGKTAFSYAVEPCTKCENDSSYEHHHEKAVEALVNQVLKLRSSMGATWRNCEHVAAAFKILGWNWNGSWVDDEDALDPPDGFHIEMSKAEKFKINSLSLSLRDFVYWESTSKKNAVNKYALMSEVNRGNIDRVFNTVDLFFEELLPILKLQHRKAVMRFQLLQATSSLNTFIRFPLPDLCTKKILGYLKIADLKRLVTAMNLEN